MQAKSKKYGDGSTAWAKGAGTSENEPWAKQPQRPARFTSSTKGIRLRPQQLEWVNAQLAADPEQTYSRLVREGLDLLKKKREGLIQVLAPAR